MFNGHRARLFTAIISAAAGLAASAAVQADATNTAVQSQVQTRAFNIPAGGLDQALNRFAQQAGVTLAANGALTAGKRSVGLRGTYSVPQALQTLLAGSGLRYRFTRADTLVLEEDQQQLGRLDSIVISGEKISRGIADTASSVSVFTELEARQTVTSTNAMLEGVSNVLSTEGTNYAPTVRGVDGTGPARGAMAFFAGSRTRLGMLVDGRPAEFNELVFGDSSLWDVDQVEVFRGPQSTLNGRNSIAGAVVVTTKNPTFYQEGAVKVTGGSLNHRQISGMYSAPINEDWAFRIAAEKKTKESFLDFEGYPGVPDADEYQSSMVRAKLLYEPQEGDFSHLITVNHQDHFGPQAEGVVRPFEDKVPDSPNTAIFNPRSTGVSMESSWVMDDTYTLENSVHYADINVKRRVPTVGRGNADIDTKTLLIEPRLKFELDNLYGFVGLHYYNADQDEFIDIFNSSYDDQTRSVAIFGETSFALTDATELTLGGRWEKETRKREGGNGPFVVNLDETYRAFSPKASLNVQLNPQWSVGAVVSKGFNGGGAGVTFEPPFVSYTYEPEKVWNYEAFARAELLDGRLFLSSNLFYSDYQDMQVPFNLGPSSIVIRNAESVESYGLEFDARWLPVPQLQLSAGMGLLKTQIKNFSNGGGTGLVGNELARAPALTADLGVLYRLQNGFEIGADARYSGSYFSDVANTERAKIDPHWILNMQAGYTHNDVRVFAFVRNLTDEEHVAFYRTVGATPATDLASLQQPRTFGLGVEMKF